jgi:PAS domain S-box-containing protein
MRPSECENLIQSIADHASDGILIVQNEKIVLCNRAVTEMTGITPEKLNRNSLSDIFKPRRDQKLEDLFDPKSSAKYHNRSYKVIIRTATDQFVNAGLSLQKLDWNEEPAVLCLIQWIPEAPIEDALSGASERYRTLWELSPSGILLESADGTIIDANPALCRYMGYSRDELIGKPVHILAHPEKQTEVSRNIGELLTGKVLRHKAKSVAKDGTLRFMELHETKVIMPNGEPGILSIATDATEQIRADEEKLKREKMQSVLEIAGAVCHELNQPMTVVSVNCDLIMMNQFNEQEVFNKIDVIKKQLRRMTDITKKLMHITKYETRDYLDGTRIVDIDRASGYTSQDSPENDP